MRNIFSLPETYQPVRGNKVTTIAKLGKEWRISFSFQPSNYGLAPTGDRAIGTTNLLHLTLRDNTTDSTGEHGERIPAIFFQPNRGMIVASSIGDEPNYVQDFKADLPPLNQLTKIEVSQLRREGRYTFKIKVGKKELHSVENEKPQEFTNVSVYVSNPWLPSTIGKIRDLRIDTNNGGKHKKDYLIFLALSSSMHLGQADQLE